MIEGITYADDNKDDDTKDDSNDSADVGLINPLRRYLVIFAS